MIVSQNIPLITRRLGLDAARDSAVLDYSGHFIAIRDADNLTTEITVAIDRPDGQTFTLRRGQGFRHLAFNRLYITHTAQAGKWVQLVVAGEPGDVDKRLFEVLIPPPAQDVLISGQLEALDVTIVGQEDDGDPLDVNVPGGVSVMNTLDTRPHRRTVPSAAGGFFNLVASNNDGTLTTLGTVPVDKQYVIERASIENAGDRLSWAELTITKADDTIVLAMRSHLFVGINGWAGYIVPAGYKIKYQSSGGTNGDAGSIFGTIEDA